jgi:small subunit ribosomal protein S6
MGIPIGEIMNTYEITNIVREGSVEDVKKSLSDIFQKHSITVSSQEDWGSKRLWHHIDGQETGFYVFSRCKAEPSSISKIEREFHLNQNILRSMVIRSHG